MRIALNLLGYTPQRGGVSTYINSIFRSIEEVDACNEYLVLCDPTVAACFLSNRPNFKLELHSIEKPSLGWFMRGVGLQLAGFDLLKWVLRELNVDVMHHPLATLNPRGLACPAVLTFHDMQHVFFPQLFSPKELNRRRREYRASVEEAHAVIAISQHVKDCLLDRYGMPTDKVHVVHHGCPSEFRRIDDPQRLASVVEKYDLRRPFMIYPAATWAHKNHLRLLNAVHILVQRGCFDGELLLTGAPMDFHGQVFNEIHRLGLGVQVRWLGYLPDEDLPCLYSLARLMVFPSLFEGFGLPVIEAMACGCPVAAARATALPEVAGDAARYFDAHAIEDIAGTLLEIWEGGAQREQMARSGLQRAGRFSWQITARQTIEVYAKVSEQGRRGSSII